MLKDYLKLHFIVLLWGFTAILGKLLTVPPVELVFWRTLLAATGLAALLAARAAAVARIRWRRRRGCWRWAPWWRRTGLPSFWRRGSRR